MKRLAARCACALQVLSAPLFCQIAQDHPELCGGTAQVAPLPAPISFDGSNATEARLYYGNNRSLTLKGVNDKVQEVCPLPSGRAVVFGEYNGIYTINIVDLPHAEVADSFEAYDPLMSPDERWIAYRRFYSPHSEVLISEEYLLYDLQATAAANRRSSGLWARGWAMYPVFPGYAPADLLDIPDANTHYWRSKSFFWAPDSEALMFADAAGGQLSLVLVRTKNGKPETYTYPVSDAVCTKPGGTAGFLTLREGSIIPLAGASLDIVASFGTLTATA